MAKSQNILGLTDKQERFCAEYVKDFNATQAAIRAGYSQKTGGQIGEQNLKKLEIQKRITELTQQLQQKDLVTKEELINELKNIAFFDIRKIFTVDGGLKNVKDFGDAEAAALAGLESFDVKEPESGMVLGTTQKVKILNKIHAIERICKMLGFDAPEKKELSGNVGFTFEETVV